MSSNHAGSMVGGHMADANAAASVLPGNPNVERPHQQLEDEAKLQRGKRKHSRFQQQAGTVSSLLMAENASTLSTGTSLL